MRKLLVPTPFIHTTALVNHAPIEAEEFVEIIASDNVIAASKAVEETHADGALPLRGVLPFNRIGTVA